MSESGEVDGGRPVNLAGIPGPVVTVAGLVVLVVGVVAAARGLVVGWGLMFASGWTVRWWLNRADPHSWGRYVPPFYLAVTVLGAGTVVAGWAAGGGLLFVGILMLAQWQQRAPRRAWEPYVMPSLWLGLCAAVGLAALLGREGFVIGFLLLIGGIGGAWLTAGAFDRRLWMMGDGALEWGPFRRT